MPTLLTPVSTNATGAPPAGADLITPSNISNFNAAVTTSSTPPAPAAAGTGPTAELAALIKQLIPLLQQLLGGNQGGSSTAGQAGSGAAHEGAAHEGDAAPKEASKAAPEAHTATTELPKAIAATSAAAAAGSSDQLSTLIPQLISLLQTHEGETAAPKEAPEAPAAAHADAAQAGGSKSDLTSLLTQLIALLEKVLGTSGSSDAGKTGSASMADPKTESLIKQLITQLQPQAQGGATPTAPTPTPTTPTTGSAEQPDYTPGMGISGAEINAMIAAANGTGPEIVLSDWSKGTPSYVVPTTSPTAGGQVANLGSQVGNEAA